MNMKYWEIRMNEEQDQEVREVYERMMEREISLDSKLKELKQTGSVRFYEKEGFDLSQLFDIFHVHHHESYAYGITEYEKGNPFLEVVKFEEEN